MEKVMKVTQLCATVNGDTGTYSMFYSILIDGRQIILERTLYRRCVFHGGYTPCELDDYISKVYNFGYDVKKFQAFVQELKNNNEHQTPSDKRLLEWGKEIFPEMISGRDADLSLANIRIYPNNGQHRGLYYGEREPKNDKEKQILEIYQYLMEQKVEECTRYRLEQLKEAFAVKPAVYDINTYLKQYERDKEITFSDEQRERASRLEHDMQNCVAMGKFNLNDYLIFLSEIPYVLAQERIFVLGYYTRDNCFCYDDWNRDIFLHPTIQEVANEYAIIPRFSSHDQPNKSVPDFPDITKRMSRRISKATFCTMPIDKNLIGRVSPIGSYTDTDMEKKIIGFICYGEEVSPDLYGVCLDNIGNPVTTTRYKLNPGCKKGPNFPAQLVAEALKNMETGNPFFQPNQTPEQKGESK